ncbi:MAG: DUF177 domain-containing protein [Firmicutes bacterium]|nr:DUF177 domain-containing protein [Bacillota bacterium]
MESLFKVNISPLQDAPGETMEFHTKLSIPNLTGVGNRLIEMINPWVLELQVTSLNQRFQVSGRLTGNYELSCDRCLEKVRLPMDTELFALYYPDGDHFPPEEGLAYTGDELDLTPLLLEAINLKLPMKNVCSLDCKGLCPVCGIDLNTHTCNCQKEAFDPRLAGLLKWKEQEGGGSGGQS